MAVAFLDVARAPAAASLAPPAAASLAPPAAAARPAPAAAAQPSSPSRGFAAAGSLVFGAGAALASTRRGGARRARAACRAAGGVQSAVEEPKEAPAEPREAAAKPRAQAVAGPGLQTLIPSRAVPFLPEPGYRRYVRNVPGDAGFDPLGLAGETPDEYVRMLEAELKHGRLAMLAGVGFVASELLHSRLAELLGAPDLMADYGCTPTLLNGGLLEPVLLGSLVPIFGVMAFADISIPRNTGLPGYYGWDPLNFGDVEFSQLAKSLLQNDTEWVAEAEQKHGRVAMIAVTYMALREYITEEPIWPSL